MYPGTCLLEATNVNEGRGTEAPFLMFGAPWLRTEAVAGLQTPGLRLEPATFVPAASSSAPEPKHRGERCRGFRVRVEDASAVRPYAFGIALVARLRSTQPDLKWVRDGEWLDTLLGTRRVRRALERGDSVDAVLAADESGVETFMRDRKPILLY